MTNITPIKQTIQANKFVQISGNGEWFFLQECSGEAKVRINGGIAIPFKRAMTYTAEPGQFVRDIEIINLEGAAIEVLGYIGRGKLEDNGVDVSGSVAIDTSGGPVAVSIGGGGLVDVEQMHQQGASSFVTSGGWGPVLEVINPAVNVGGAVLRTIAGIGGDYTEYNIYGGTVAPTAWNAINTGVKLLGHVNSNGSRGSHKIDLPQFLPAGTGLWVTANSAAFVGGTFDLL